ncbi:MAG TPA: esterase YqiA, partial [Oceanospirillaceae bacterium]|nr:esterase YqiA [Oceanospirillaceae bacterium]
MAPVYIYLHGFNSSPASHKAQQFKRAISQTQPEARVVIPELSPWPAQAMQQVESLVADVMPTANAPLVFLGSS